MTHNFQAAVVYSKEQNTYYSKQNSLNKKSFPVREFLKLSKHEIDKANMPPIALRRYYFQLNVAARKEIPLSILDQYGRLFYDGN
jgi:hypothetical protein